MKKRTQGLVALTLVSGVLAGALTGCGQRSGGEVTNQEQNVLVYRSIWNAEEPQAAILQDALDDFAEQNDVTIDVKFLGRSGGDSLAAEMAAGQGPDLFDAASDNLPSWRAQGLAAPIDDVLSLEVPGEDGKTLGDLLPAALVTAASDDDGLGFVPHTAISSAVWFDAAAHTDLATVAPQNWAEFLAYLDQAKADGRVPICQDGTVPFYNAYWISSAIVDANGAGSLRVLQEDPAAWDQAYVLEAADRVAQLAAGDYFQPDFIATKYPAAQNDWVQGKCDLLINGTWVVGEVAPVTPADAKISSFPLPVGGKGSVEAGALGLGVNAKGKHIELAKEFLAYFAQSRYQERISTEAGNIPARSDIAAPAALVASQQEIADATETHLTYDRAAGDKAWWNDLFLPLSDQLITGKVSPEEFVAQGKEKTQKYLDGQR